MAKVGEFKGKPVVCFYNSDSYLSNCYTKDYKIRDFYTGETITVNCAQQNFQFLKARRFSDHILAGRILRERLPGRQKSLGKRVLTFSFEEWDKECAWVMAEVLKCKFENCDDLKERLLFDITPDTYIVEASREKKWGSGVSMESRDLFDLSQHKGRNLMGRCLKHTYYQLIGSKENAIRVINNEFWTEGM